MLKSIWNYMNGKKFFSGLFFVIAGIFCFRYEFTAPAAPHILYFGLGLSSFGGAHKINKRMKGKSNVNLKG